METKNAYNKIMAVLLSMVTLGPVMAQIHIPGDRSVGTWDSHSRTYTLTTDTVQGLVIDEDNLTLNGAGHQITGAGVGEGITLVNRNDVIVTGATAQGFYHGIYLDSCTNCAISDNSLPGNEETGIFLLNSNDNSLTGNNVSETISSIFNHAGIFLRGSNNNTLSDNTLSDNIMGMYLLSSQSNLITNNTLLGNRTNGIVISTASGYNVVSYNFVKSDDGVGIVAGERYTEVSNNLVLNHTWGIRSFGGYGEIIKENTIAHHIAYGIEMRRGSGTVYNNNFINNGVFYGGIQAFADERSTASFNLPLPDGGNFWFNWRSPDNNVDEVVDLPYVFTGGQDNLPWANPVAWVAVAPIWPTGASLAASDVSPGSLILRWTPAKHDILVSGYKVYLDGVLVKHIRLSQVWSTPAYIVHRLDPDTEYTFKVEACELTDVCTTDGPSVVVRTPKADTDGDGIIDDDDACVNSDLSPTVVIDGCDSGVTNFLLDDGCTISDLIAMYAAEANNHGQFTSDVTHLTNDLVQAGLISSNEKGQIQNCAAQAGIP